MSHGRHFLVEETIESFLRQSPCGWYSELLILNDCPEQTLVYSHPRIIIVNADKPIRDLSDKQNVGVMLSKGHFVMLWDDDDIFLPNRIANARNEFSHDPALCAVAPHATWFLDNGEITGRGRRPHLGAGCFARAAYLACGGAVKDSPPDQSYWDAMSRRYKCYNVYRDAKNTDMIYRWYGTGGAHDSDATVKAKTNEERHEAFRAKTLTSPLFKCGVVDLKPTWKQDYVGMVNKAIADGKGKIDL